MTLTEILHAPEPEAARRLLGCRLISEVGGEITEVVLTDVEAYAPDDPASHSFRGRTPRNRSMFGPAGTLYVYRSYGVHWCANIATGPPGHGAAVLLRGGRIVVGIDEIRRRRGRDDHLTDGPGKLCQALGVTGEHDGLDLLSPNVIRLEQGEPVARLRSLRRVGISRAVELPWRFVADV